MSEPARWSQGAVGYEVYLRSFMDADGDGIGDLPGLRSRLPYLVSLGVDVIWVTPFYPSPMADHGYDVADYTGVDPRFGTLTDVDDLIREAHDLGLKVIIDLVPNHTSSDHPWFQAARSSRDNPFRNFYIWSDPAPDGGPPNNWISHFGGSAWTLDEASGQYWLHLFLPEQPDLNWANPAVADAFDHILRFWLDRRVDGFRVDVAHALIKDADLRDNPVADPSPAGVPGGEQRSRRHSARARGADQCRSEAGDDSRARLEGFDAFEYRYDVDQPGVLHIFRRWRPLVAPYGALLLGEVYLLDPVRVARYVSDQQGLHLAFCFTAVRTRWDADCIRSTLRDAVEAGNGRFAWPASSHDDPRAPTRFGGGRRGAARSLAYLTLLLGLPGMPFLYQGDELGLENGVVPLERATDPARAAGHGEGRDASRTPMPWEPGPGMGFTTGEPWLPFGGRRPRDTVAMQERDPASALHRTRALIAARKALPDLRGDAPVQWLVEAGPLVAFQRGRAVVAANCGAETADLKLPWGAWQVAFSTRGGGGSVGTSLPLAPAQAVILRLGGNRGSSSGRDPTP